MESLNAKKKKKKKNIFETAQSLTHFTGVVN